MTHAVHTPFLTESESKFATKHEKARGSVRNNLSVSGGKTSNESNTVVSVLDSAAALGISPARLRGLILRNDFADPIGDLYHVRDDWRLRRLAVQPSASQP